MQQRAGNRRGRGGFSMVELMVVIAILAILLALVTAGTLKYLRLGPDNKNKAELRQLDMAMQQVKNEFGMYPPSRLKVCQWLNLTYYPYYQQPGTLDSISVRFLTAGKYNRAAAQWQSPAGITWTQSPLSNGKAWDGKPIILEGDQVLVFALGGIQSIGNGVKSCNGWSLDATNPGNTSVTPGLAKPYYQFQSERLVQRKADSPFFSYLDAYPDYANLQASDYYRVFAYFSNYNAQNGYNKFVTAQQDQTYASAPGPNHSDCWTLLQGSDLWPWALTLTPGASYQNPDKFQILSPGRDGRWGSGTIFGNKSPTWQQGNAGAIPADAQDDWSNFSEGTLGSG